MPVNLSDVDDEALALISADEVLLVLRLLITAVAPIASNTRATEATYRRRLLLFFSIVGSLWKNFEALSSNARLDSCVRFSVQWRQEE